MKIPSGLQTRHQRFLVTFKKMNIKVETQGIKNISFQDYPQDCLPEKHLMSHQTRAPLEGTERLRQQRRQPRPKPPGPQGQGL